MYLFFSDRKKLIKEYIKWTKKNHTKNNVFVFLGYLQAKGYLNIEKIAEDLKKVD